jgi:hypothetical protein
VAEGDWEWEAWDAFLMPKFERSGTSDVDDVPMEMISLPFHAPFYQDYVNAIWISPNGCVFVLLGFFLFWCFCLSKRALF